MPAFLWLIIAIGAEVAATTSLKLSEGFTKLIPSAIVAVGYILAFIALAQVLKAGMAVGVAYAVWAAAGVAAVAIIGWLALGEQMSWTIAGGLLLVIAGVVLIEVGQA